MARGRKPNQMTQRRRQAHNGRPPSRRKEMVDYVYRIITRDGVAPSYSMICEALGISTRQEVSRMVQAAERSGELRRVGVGRVRRIRLAAEVFGL